MDLNNIGCVSSSNGIHEDDIQHHSFHHPHPHPHHYSKFSFVKPCNGGGNNNNNVMGTTAIAPTASVHQLLECLICTNSMSPPIHQCHNGHILCSTCKTRVHNRCPTCRQELGDIRCLSLEKVVELLELPYKYYSIGCLEIFSYYSKLKHETISNSKPYNCSYVGLECSIVGNIPFLIAHLRDNHKVDMHIGYTFNHRYVKSNPCVVENATWMFTVFHCFGQYFCLHFEAFQPSMAPVYMVFFILWAMRMRHGTVTIALRLVQMAGNLSERVHHKVLGIATVKLAIVMMVSLFNKIWHYFSLVEIRRS